MKRYELAMLVNRYRNCMNALKWGPLTEKIKLHQEILCKKITFLDKCATVVVDENERVGLILLVDDDIIVVYGYSLILTRINSIP